MSKERLKDIKERVLVDRVYYKYLDGTKGHWGKTYTLDEEDYKYLYEQAERVQELETTVYFYQSALRDADRRVQKLESRIADDEHFVAEILEQNKRYREALSIISANLPLDGREHYVDIARQALEGEGNA